MVDLSLKALPLLVLALAAGLVLWNHIRLRRTFRRLEDMLDSALQGQFREEVFDESRLSALEVRLAQYLAVSAAGTTLYELCALGVPAVSFTMADNQLTAARAFADAGAIPCAGDIRENSGKVIEEILLFVTEMSELCFDCVPAAPASCLVPRKAARQAMIRLTDGTGAMKIAQALWKL